MQVTKPKILFITLFISLFALFIYRKKSTNRWLEKKKKKWWTVHIGQTKSTVTFIHSLNKCHNIFTKHLFLIVVGHSFIFYYFILTYKKLTPQ